ncbi:MAG: CopG family transcriptional regulator [Tepidimonas sp.]
MSRLTITLDDGLHQALKEAAVRQGRSINKIIEESLVMRGIKPLHSARAWVAQARQRAGLAEADALALSVEETRRIRGA